MGSPRLRSNDSFPQTCPAEIHGEDGLGGVEGLPDRTDAAIVAKLQETKAQTAVLAIAEAARALPRGEQLALVATGSLTNAALFVSLFPDLVRDKVSQIVIMGGAEGRGNRSPTAEFNILCDPHAASIVFDAEVPVVMAVRAGRRLYCSNMLNCTRCSP